MELIVGKCAGMCEGVNYAVKKAKEIVKENKKIYKYVKVNIFIFFRIRYKKSSLYKFVKSGK